MVIDTFVLLLREHKSFKYVFLGACYTTFWETRAKLNFQAHLKPNQELKYLNQGSNHTKVMSKAIPHGVLSRLTKLTTMTDEDKNMRMNALYPEHMLLLLRKQNLHLKNGPA
jgi:hypothetical protein